MSDPYKVQPGDTMSKIATDHHVSVNQMVAANPQIAASGRGPNQLRVGETLTIPPSGFSAAKPAGGTVAPCPNAKSFPCDDCLYQALGANTPAEKAKVQPYIGPLKDTFQRYNIDNPAKQSMFLGEMKHETQDFTKFTEGGGYDVVGYNGSPYNIKGAPKEIPHPGKPSTFAVQLRERLAGTSLNKFTGQDEWRASPDHNKKGAAFQTVTMSAAEKDALDTGRVGYFQYLNQHIDAPGKGIDNSLFKGRGAFQLTHYDAYKGYTDYRKANFGDTLDYATAENADKLASDPALAMDSAGWFWNKHMPSKIKDATTVKDVDAASRVINSKDTDTFPARKQNTEGMYAILSKPECAEKPADPAAAADAPAGGKAASDSTATPKPPANPAVQPDSTAAPPRPAITPPGSGGP